VRLASDMQVIIVADRGVADRVRLQPGETR
jgi:hypothetical protein